MKIGVIGAGQLGQMLGVAGVALGHRFTFIDPNPDAPAAAIGPLVKASFDDVHAISRLDAVSDVLTYEFENVPVSSLSGVPRERVFPPQEALEVSQDRYREKSLFRELGIPTPRFALVESADDVRRFADEVGFPIVLKTRRLGYDGKGQRLVSNEAEAQGGVAALGHSGLIAEEFLRFDRELSIIACRGRDGSIECYPLVENHHEGGILRLSLAPAPQVSTPLSLRAKQIVSEILERLKYVGVLTVELFDLSGELYANELAPRVHNSGHWTIEGAETSQFENHIRAITGAPLGSCAPRGVSAMVNLIGDPPKADGFLRIPGLHLHLYGKEPRPGRKIGHLTFSCPSTFEISRAYEELCHVMPNVRRYSERISHWGSR